MSTSPTPDEPKPFDLERAHELLSRTERFLSRAAASEADETEEAGEEEAEDPRRLYQELLELEGSDEASSEPVEDESSPEDGPSRRRSA